MEIEELKVYQLSMELAEKVWCHVLKWDYFVKDTVGKQLVKAADSVSANISEGFGRYHYNEAKHFYYYARGSLSETKTWLSKASNRSFITKETYDNFVNDIKTISIKLNNYINVIGKGQKNNGANEGAVPYGEDDPVNFKDNTV
jgi:four helix bundle protein